MNFAHAFRTLLLGAIVALPFQAGAATVTHSFNLSGAQEVPAVGSLAAGSAQFTIDDQAGTITFFSAIFNLQGAPAAAHIHAAAAGVNGPVVFDLGANSDSAGPVIIGPFSVPNSLAMAGVSKTIDVALAAAINATPWLYYMNVHTSAFPGGEVRGQLAPIPVPAALWLMPAALGLVLRRRATA